MTWPPRAPDLARLHPAWRERWGRLCNQLQDRGVPWPDHEIQAYEALCKVLDEGIAAGKPVVLREPIEFLSERTAAGQILSFEWCPPPSPGRQDR
jgi:hypothetical protein